LNSTHTICYVSKANPALTNEEISEIFTLTENNNRANNISGILLHSLGNFFQVLEGEEKLIEDLYESQILNDPRHSSVFEIYRGKIRVPIFTNYLSNFRAITTTDELLKIHTYLEANKSISTSEKLSRILKPFIIFE
jgi:hypothetical protein